MTSFDCLNRDLLFEIFDYLSFGNVILAFFNLQQRINDAIRAYPASIDLSRTRDRRVLTHGPFLCRALLVTNDEDDSQTTPIDYSQIDFRAIRAINFQYIHFIKLQIFLERLPIEKLESITIRRLESEDAPEDVEQQIWSIITIAGRNKLRYLHVSDPIIRWNAKHLLDHMPSLKYVTFKQMYAREMLTFLQYTPNLQSLNGTITIRDFDELVSDVSVLHLTHLDLYINNCDSFERLHQILSICPFLTHFTLVIWIKSYNESLVDAIGWQTLIEECLPHLIYLKIRLYRYVRVQDALEPDVELDSTDYWERKKPQFDIRYMEV